MWGWRALLAAVALAARRRPRRRFATPQVRERVLDEGRSGIDKVTSGRANLVGQGVRITLDHPVGGVGVGSFKRVVRRARRAAWGASHEGGASHTTPVTVAAETGIVGLVALPLARSSPRSARALAGPRATGFTSRVSFAVGLTLCAITVHSLFYNALLRGSR